MKSNNETEEPLFYKYYNQLLEDTVMNQSQTQDFLYNSLIKDLNWESVIEESKKTQKSTCGKPIKEGELCFQCMDCAILKENHLLCEECFCKVDHRNHRVKFKNSIWGYCDCGDEDAILNSAFCISHQSKIINEREIRKQIPKITRDKLNNSLNFLFLKCLHEAEDEIKVLNTVEKIFFVGEKVIRQLNCLFSSISKMIDDSFRILIFLANFLIKPLNQKKIDNAFFHECDLIDDLTFSTGGKKPCKCSILGIIFKFNQFLSEELRNQIVEVIFKLSPSTFLKEHIIFLMLRNINQIIELKLIKNQDPQNEKVIFSVSQFTKLHLFYIINKDIAEKFVVSQEFNNVICKIKREYLIQDSPFHEEISRSIRNTIIFYLWKFANLKKITELFFENPKILQELLIILLSVKPKEEKFDKPKEVSFLNTNYVFFLFIKKMLKLLNDDENEMKKIGIMTKIFEKLLIDIFFCSINEKTNLLFLRESNQLMKDIHFMNHISSKLFGLFMGFFIQNFDYKFAKLNDFLINLLQKSNIKISHFTSTFTTQLILTLFSKYSITISKETPNEIRSIINFFYTTTHIGFEAFDRFALKIIFLLEFGPFENVSQISNYIFEQIGSNLQLSKLKDPNILLALRDLEAINFLLEFINVLIFDDISLINTLNATKTLKLSENPNSNHGYPTKNLEFLFANIYLVEPNFNYEPIKTLLKKLKKREIDYLIERISIFNKSRNAYELKEEYKNSFDLILFPESLSLYAKLYERAKSICKKDFSIILGNHDMSFYENPFFIKTMDKIANSDLIEFVVILFLDENNQVVYEKNDILRKVLKLLHLFLQYKASKLKISMFLKINLRKRIDILIIKFKANQDYEIALRKIGQILDESINFEEIKKEPFFSPNKMTDLKLNEKDLKKASILAEFKKKSMKFIEKNHEITDSNMNLKKDEKDLMVCSFCLQNQIKSNDLLGLLAYISKDSITDYIYPGNHSKNNDLLKKKGNFYVNSCNHLVHKECHYSNLTNKNRINMKNYECDIEFMCNYCKNLSNLIVPNIEITCYSPDLSEFINCKKDFLDNPELFLQFVDNYQVKKINLDEMLDIKYKEFFYDFYNELMMAVLGYFEEGMNNSTFEILVEILFDLFEKIYWKDLFSFISNDFLLTTNLFYLSLFDFYQIENNQMILDKCKFKVSLGNVMNVLGNLKNDLNINCLQRDLIKSLLNIRFIFNNDKKLLICATQYLIKSFVSQLMILCFFIYNTDNTHFTLENLMNFFLNNEIKSKTMTFLGPFYSIIIGFLISCFKSYPKLKTLLESSQIENELENSDLLKEFEALLMPEPEICKVYIDNWKNHMNNLTEQDKNKLLLTLKSITNNVKTLSISKINNYDEFLVNCMTKGCYICKFYPRKFKQKLFQCLICDIQLCIGRCDDEKKKIGNLTEHARNFHKGKCIFIDLSEGTLLIIKMSFLLMLRTAFVNKHGDLMKENCMNFSSYLLDKRFVDKWVHSIINRKLAQEVINEISVNPDSLIENPNWSMI